MYDRLYSLTIKHPKLKTGVLKINGDSAKLCHNITFSARIINDLSTTGTGRVTVYGLPTDLVNTLAMHTLDRFNGAKADDYTLALHIGYRDLQLKAEMYAPILKGSVLTATPGALPDRSITFDVGVGNLKSPIISQITNQDQYIPIKDFIESCHRYLLGAGYDNFSFEFGTLPTRYVANRPPFETVSKFLDFLNSCGIPYHAYVLTKVSKDSVVEETPYLVTGAMPPEDIVSEISEQTGMIGLPSPIDNGASVSNQMRLPTPLGNKVKLISKWMPNLNRVYKAAAAEYSGEFYADRWQETLQLYRI